MTTNLTDENERLSALDTGCSHHVESPAGSGKKYCCINEIQL